MLHPRWQKNIYFRFWLQYYWRAWDKEKIQSSPTITEKKYIFGSVYSTTAWDLEKMQSTLPYPKKTSFWLQCYYGTWDLEKMRSHSTVSEKNSGYITTTVHRSWKKLNWRSTPSKKYIFSSPSTVLLWFMGLERIDLTGPSQKKYIFASDYSINVVHRT